MPRHFLILLVSAAFCLFAQKPSLTGLDNGQKKAAEAAQAAQKQAAQKQAASDAGQLKILSQQDEAAHQAQTNHENAGRQAQDLHDAELIAATKAEDAQEVRMSGFEQTLAMLQRDKKQQEDDEREWHHELKSFGWEILAGVMVAAILTGVQLLASARRHRAEQKGREEAHCGRKAAAESARIQDAKTDQIHALVNSKLTSALKSQLAWATLTLAALRRLAKMGTPEPEDAAMIESARKEIAGLSVEISDRLTATEAGIEAKESELELPAKT